MNVYFTASIVGKKHYLKNYLEIIEILKNKGFQVQSDHIIKSTEEEIRMETIKKRMIFHQKLQKWISSCDLLVAEVSFPSISVGYEISKAVHMGKPALLLYQEGNGPSLFIDYDNDRVACEKYANYSLKEIIEDFLRFVAGTSDTRFTFFIPREMNNYLEKSAKHSRLSKAAYLRNLIKKDTEKK